MIKFVSHTLPLPEKVGLGSVDKLIHNKSNSALTAQFNNRFKGKHCEEHPDFENEIVVNLSDEGNSLIIGAYCCNNFKKKLDSIVQGRDPFFEVNLYFGSKKLNSLYTLYSIMSYEFFSPVFRRM
jgi:hypothetical protein